VHDGRKQAGALIKTAEETSYELEQGSDSDFPPYDLEAEMSEEERRIYERSLTPTFSPSLSPLPTSTALVPISSAALGVTNLCTALSIFTSPPDSPPASALVKSVPANIIVDF